MDSSKLQELNGRLLAERKSQGIPEGGSPSGVSSALRGVTGGWMEKQAKADEEARAHGFNNAGEKWEAENAERVAAARAQAEARAAREAEAKRPERMLEAGGFRREVESRDFDLLCKAVEAARRNRRGLLFKGGTGCGKTLAARSLLPRARLIRPFPKALKDAFELAQEGTLPGEWILDDLGAEPVANDYGIHRELSAEFIYLVAEDAANAGGFATTPIITTNCDAAFLAQRYGERIMSRVAGLFIPVSFSGKDKRKPKEAFR